MQAIVQFATHGNSCDMNTLPGNQPSLPLRFTTGVPVLAGQFTTVCLRQCLQVAVHASLHVHQKRNE